MGGKTKQDVKIVVNDRSAGVQTLFRERNRLGINYTNDLRTAGEK